MDVLTHTKCAHGVLWAPVVIVIDTEVRLVLVAFLLALVQEVVVNLRNDSLRPQGIIILRQLVRLIVTLGQVHRASSVGIRNRVVAFFPPFPRAGNLLAVGPGVSLLIPPGVTAEYFLNTGG